MKRFFICLLFVAGLLTTSTTQLSAQDQNVVEIAAGNENFSTLVAAVKAAGLAGTLSGDGPFTVFAPTDAAFAALPDGLVAALVKPENKTVLQKILTYHVVSGKLMASDVVAGIKSGGGMLSAGTVEGGKFTVMTDGGKVKIKDAQNNVATVTATDIAGTNGVIHVIDRVILPAGVNPGDLLKGGSMEKTMDKSMGESMEKSMDKSMGGTMGKMIEQTGPTIAAVASGNDNFKTLVAALGAAGLVETFDSFGEYTVFAPTDAAFDALPEGTVNSLVTNQKDKLKGILAYHVIPARISSGKLVQAIKDNKNFLRMSTLGGQSLIATVQDGKVMLIDGNGNRSTVIITDVEASNGVIHAIDSVVMPR